MSEASVIRILQKDICDLSLTDVPSNFSLVIADPPYGISKGLYTVEGYTTINEKWDSFDAESYRKFTQDWLQVVESLMGKPSTIYCFSTYHNLDIILPVFKNFFKLQTIFVWNKRNPMPNSTARMYTHSNEFVLVGTKGEKWVFNKKILLTDFGSSKDFFQSGIVSGKERVVIFNGRYFRAQKPVKLIELFVKASSNENDWVLDAFSGSGTTSSVCQGLNRNCIAVERDENCIELIRKRLGFSQRSQC